MKGETYLLNSYFNRSKDFVETGIPMFEFLRNAPAGMSVNLIIYDTKKDVMFTINIQRNEANIKIFGSKGGKEERTKRE